MTEPLVSIIIPTYNREHLLVESINNALEQTYQNIEIVIIDDGSKDGTKALMSDYQHPKVSYFYKENGGPSSARNEGIRRAKGDYIAFMDSDDLWDKSKLKAQIDFLESNQDVGMLSTNYRFINGAGNIIKDPGASYGYTTKNGFIQDIASIEFPLATTSTFAVRTSVLKDVGVFNEDLGISEDLDLWVRIGLKHKVDYIDQVLVSVRLHDLHLMGQTARDEVWQQSVTVLESHRTEILKVTPNADKLFSKFYEKAGDIALISGARKKASVLFFKALVRDAASLTKYKNLVRCFMPLQFSIARHEKSINKKENPILQKYR